MSLAHNPWTYTLITLGVVTIFWCSTIWRRVRANAIYQPDPRETVLAIQRNLAADLLAATVLALLLGALLRPEVIGLFDTGITTCGLALPIGPCGASGAAAAYAPSLSTLNFIQAALYGDPALVVLGLLAATGGLTRTALPNALRGVWRYAIAAVSAAFTLRNIAWPVVLLLGTASLAVTSLAIQTYLQSPKSLHDALADLPYVLVSGVVAVLAVTASLTLQLTGEHIGPQVAAYQARLIGLTALIVLLTFWLFGLALSLFNQLLVLAGITNRQPFGGSHLILGISGASLVLFGTFVFVRRLRGKRSSHAR